MTSTSQTLVATFGPDAQIATPPTYWEIEAKGKARGAADYQAFFLVPVYKAS